MKRRDFLLSTAALGSLALADTSPATEQPSAALAAGNEPLVKGGVYQAGSRAQLFVDQMVVRQADNVAFTLHPARKHPANPLLVADQPCEGWRIEIYGNVIFDHEEQIFKMWYIGESPGVFPSYAALYATSTDGIHWQKPLVGTIEAAVPGKHNAVCRWSGPAQRLQGHGRPRSGPPLQDDHLPMGRKIPCARQSESGVSHLRFARWTELDAAQRKASLPGADVITGYYDRRRKLWVVLAKITDVPAAKGRRVFG